MKKVFAYLRVSGKSQVDGDGFPRQIKAIREYAEAHDLTIAKIYREEGVSGTRELQHRPALAELVDKLSTNGVRTVIIEKLDRLARDLMVQETIIADWRKKGIELISVAEPDLCVDDPSRKLVRQMFGAIAEYEKEMLVLRLRGARKRIRDSGKRCDGRKPYGFKPGEQDIIAQIGALRSEGLGVDTIAGRLNDEGVKPRSGAKWYPMSVLRVINRAKEAA
jgi:DNA invertase Pin-like site-specific DNA recombinase